MKAVAARKRRLGTTVTCAIPAAQITIAGGKAENALVVPSTAVKGCRAPSKQ